MILISCNQTEISDNLYWSVKCTIENESVFAYFIERNDMLTWISDMMLNQRS